LERHDHDRDFSRALAAEDFIRLNRDLFAGSEMFHIQTDSGGYSRHFGLQQALETVLLLGKYGIRDEQQKYQDESKWFHDALNRRIDLRLANYSWSRPPSVSAINAGHAGLRSLTATPRLACRSAAIGIAYRSESFPALDAGGSRSPLIRPLV
jgi:hypothetical protein